MKSLICLATAALLAASPAWAHSDAPAQPKDVHITLSAPASKPTSAAVALDAHTMQDIARHRGMAQAHEQAAQCLTEGQPYATCQKQLQASCKGLALGKHCGMRHSH